eukprot:241713_1
MTCISYKLSLKAHFTRFTIDWKAMSRAVKYHYRGFNLIVPTNFDLDPLDLNVITKWYSKYKNTTSFMLDYYNKTNKDFMNVFQQLATNMCKTTSSLQFVNGKELTSKMKLSLMAEQFVNGTEELKLPLVTPNMSNHPYHSNFDIVYMKDLVLKYGVFDKTIFAELLSIRIDPIDILLTSDYFRWLYKMITSDNTACQLLINIKTAEKYILDNDLTNKIWNLLLYASILFVDCFYYPAVIRKMMNNEKLFIRFMTMFHWLFDYWFHINNLETTQKNPVLERLSGFVFGRLTKIQAVYCNYLKAKHLIVYSKHIEYFKKYVLTVLEFEMNYSKNSRKQYDDFTKDERTNLCLFESKSHGRYRPDPKPKPSFRILAISLLLLYVKNKHIQSEIKMLRKFIGFAAACLTDPKTLIKNSLNEGTDLLCMPYFIYFSPMNFRIQKNVGKLYDVVYCRYKECQINYYYYLYGMEYYMLEHAKRDKTSKFDKSVRINSTWYKCSGCKLVYYCSRKCQKRDWKHHKTVCEKM